MKSSRASLATRRSRHAIALTLIEVPGSVSIQAVEKDAEQVRGAGNHIIGGHKPERDYGQDDTGIAFGERGSGIKDEHSII